MTNQSQQHLDRLFHALSDSTRRAIVMRLSEGPASVTELSKPFEMAMPTLLQHIRVLEDSGLVGTHKAGRVRTCEIKQEAFAATQTWLEKQRVIWESRLDRFEAYAASLHAKENNHGKRKNKL
ncbi:MAG: metalloregulator ArsR/SmtB family transcription factor [Pseudomonadota bacterium]